MVPLPQAVVDALKQHQLDQLAERRNAGEFWEDWGLVFTTGFGTPLSPRNDYREFRRIVERVGLRRVRLHDLRHTAATLMLGQAVSPRAIMEMLGHSQISITHEPLQPRHHRAVQGCSRPSPGPSLADPKCFRGCQ